jgi:hypothetical protein
MNNVFFLAFIAEHLRLVLLYAFIDFYALNRFLLFSFPNEIFFLLPLQLIFFTILLLVEFFIAIIVDSDHKFVNFDHIAFLIDVFMIAEMRAGYSFNLFVKPLPYFAFAIVAFLSPVGQVCPAFLFL